LAVHAAAFHAAFPPSVQLSAAAVTELFVIAAGLTQASLAA